MGALTFSFFSWFSCLIPLNCSFSNRYHSEVLLLVISCINCLLLQVYLPHLVFVVHLLPPFLLAVLVFLRFFRSILYFS